MTPNHRALLFPISVLGTATLPCRMPICTMWIDGSRANPPRTPLLTAPNEPTVHTCTLPDRFGHEEEPALMRCGPW